MTKVREIHVRCSHCEQWFPSPIRFKEEEVFDTATLMGNVVQCPNCKAETSYNKENIRVRYQNGGFVGTDA